MVLFVPFTTSEAKPAISLSRGGCFGGQLGFWAGTTRSGEHRTGVTEVTEWGQPILTLEPAPGQLPTGLNLFQK